MKLKDPSHSHRILPLALWSLFILILLSLSVASDQIPEISIEAVPSHVGIGSIIVITANASDDIGVKEIYFYFPPSSELVSESCNNLSLCTKSISRVADTLGTMKFCARANDTSGQLSDLKCTEVEVSLDRPPIIKYFYAKPTENDIPTVHVDGTVKLTIVAEDDHGVKRIFFEDVSANTTEIHECGNLKTCIFEYQKTFYKMGIFKFCTWAIDTTDQESNKSCIYVHVISKYSCELITLDDTQSEKVIALRLTSKRLHQDKDGIIGYPAHCCKDEGFCYDLEINTTTCNKTRGNFPFPDYRVLEWDPNETTLEGILSNYKYPKILCTNTLDNYTILGVIDNAKYQLVGETQNLEDGIAKYWIMKTVTRDGKDKYFFAEQLQQEENETKVSIIVDAVTYSDAVHRLLESECLEKDLESGECQFDCPDIEPRCDYSCTCGGGMALGCGYCPPKTCECCMQCHKLYNYEECIYRKYEKMYGRPYVDYLFCWRIPELKDTPWCYQKSDRPTSAVNFPWYGFTRKNNNTYRSLNIITDEYIDEIHKWNWNVEVKEKPARSGISEKRWVPEVYCDHNFDNKLLRGIWAKIFTTTPLLHDHRNVIDWTRTGEGAVYAGGGFRREPACWWECCRRCAPFCNCDCSPCSGYCCLNAHFTSGVTEVMEIRVPYTTISDGPMSITSNNYEDTSWTVSNGAITVISTGNMPYRVSASFTKDESKGLYILKQVYTPIGGWSDNKNFVADYDQFVIDEDIVLNYTLKEDAKDFSASIKETFTTSLRVDTCTCQPKIPIYDDEGNIIDWVCPPGCNEGPDCCCCPSGSKSITTTESVDDTTGTAAEIDTIKIDALKEAAHGFVDIVIPRGLNVGLVAFSSVPCPRGICWTWPLTDSASDLHREIDRYTPLYGTCIACGIHKGRDIIRGATGEKYLIVMSDGVPQCCHPSGWRCGEINAKNQALAEATAAKNEGIIVHTIALGDDADRPFMEQLAEAGGGVYYDVTCDCLLDCVYTELADLVKDNVVLVSDTTGSMKWPLTLDCPGEGIPVIYKFGRVNINITGNIDNYIDRKITTGVRSKGSLRIDVNPDIINRFIFNVGNSSIDYFSLVYPVKHNAFRKQYVWGRWIPSIPYTIAEEIYGNLPGERTYTFNESYGYESSYFNYPEQCKKICPADCTCPEDDITDVTCIDENGNKYKRTDCVCLPPKGHSYKFPCTSDRTFHEEEGYYFDFVDLETEEVSNIKLMDQLGTNPVFTGDLRGEVTHDISKKTFNTTYIFIANSKDNTVSKVRTHDCKEVCTYDVGSNPSRTAVDLKGEVWVANRNSNDVTRLDGNTCKVIDTYPVGRGPRPIAADDDNNIWVGNALDNNVWKLNGTTGECIIGDPARNPTCPIDSSPIPVGLYPYGGVYDCHGYVWIICNGYDKDDRLFKIRTSDGVVVSPPGGYRIGGDAYGIGIDSNGDIWLGGARSGNVYKVNGTTGAVICKNRIAGYTRGIVVDWDNNAWVADYTSDEVIKVNGSNCEVLGRYGVGTGPIGVTVDFDGNVWAVNRDSDDATKLNSTTGSRLCTAEVGDGPYTYSDMSGHNIWKICHNKTLKHEVVEEVSGRYILDFEAMNFPYPLIKYRNLSWYNSSLGDNCQEFCKARNQISISECNCPLNTSLKGCVHCIKADNESCIEDCNLSCSADWDSQQCCCGTPYFDLENANITIFIHFRDNLSTQTFPLFPPRTETRPYANIYINVTMRNASRVICEAIPESVNPGDEVIIHVTLLDVLTGKGIPYEEVTIELEAYGISAKVTTDMDGKAEFKFTTTDQSTRVRCLYHSRYTPSEDTTYVNVYSLSRFWWFLSPEVLLLFMILILLAFSYRWFREGRLDVYEMWDEFMGRK